MTESERFSLPVLPPLLFSLKAYSFIRINIPLLSFQYFNTFPVYLSNKNVNQIIILLNYYNHPLAALCYLMILFLSVDFIMGK